MSRIIACFKSARPQKDGIAGTHVKCIGTLSRLAPTSEALERMERKKDNKNGKMKENGSGENQFPAM